MVFTITVPQEFPLVLICVAFICFECFMVGLVLVGKARGKHFNKDFMAQFDKEHEEAFPGQKAPVGGHPDAGDGRYSEKLPYKSWIEFNNAWRAHQNFVEQLPLILVYLLVGGYVLPRFAVVVGVLNVIGRFIFVVSYAFKGSNARMIGGIMSNLPLYILGLSTFVQLIRLTIRA